MQASISKWIEKTCFIHMYVCVHDEILISRKKEWHSDICSNVDGARVFFLLWHVACRILAQSEFSYQGSNPCPLQWKRSLNHWTTREVPFLKDFLSSSIVDLQCCVSFSCTGKWFSYTYTFVCVFICKSVCVCVYIYIFFFRFFPL